MQVNFTTKIGPFALADGPISFRDLFHSPFDSARVDLHFGKSKKEENKKAFDALIAHKDEIEKVLGVFLIWNRGDKIKSSKVTYQLNGVSIENETDWLQMARFHAEWSKKFYDVIVPYLS